jgi:ribosomal protein S18 acetylase RimI-like enzyme
MSGPPRRHPGGREPPPAGIVFRRLDGGSEVALAGRLLAADGLQPPATAGASTWFGLWDLTAAGGESLVGVAVTGPVGQATVQLYAVAVRAARRRRGFGSRLVREVADTLRAQGSTSLVVAPPTDDVTVRRLVALGFRPSPPTAQDAGPGWLGLEL